MDGGIKMENNLNIFILDMKNSIEREDNLVLHDDEMIGLVKVLEDHSGKAKDTYTETMKLFKIVKEFDNLKEENNELRHALESFRQYADKLVDGIPYLPADLENAKEANWDFAIEKDEMKNVIFTLLKIIDENGLHSSEVEKARKVLGNYEDYSTIVKNMLDRNNPLNIPDGVHFHPGGTIVTDKNNITGDLNE